ncbi:hypothetical protein INT45_014242 [Circinella minor]|uniref:Restriction of telomere capping protein 4 n=1 Tax=Circinella minor TaxID=1195481 RepID=A0A8H7SEC1_9FUNG|nr:hypothetical protein INT45_014242 [Circinella minor]
MYQEMKEKITSAYISCQNNQQRQDLIEAIDSALKKFSPVPIEKLALPKSERSEKEAKEKQKVKDKKEAKQSKESKKQLSPSNKPLVPHHNKRFKNNEKGVDDNSSKEDKEKKIIHPDIPAENTIEEIKIMGDSCVLYDGLLQRMAYGVAPQLLTRSACCKEYWFNLALDIQVAANSFSLPLASYSDSIHESELHLPYGIPARQPLPEIMYFVRGDHFQTIRTKIFPRMIWPPVSPKSLAIWESRRRDPKIHKAAWKYIHRKKYPIVQTGKPPITVEDDGGKPQMKKDELQKLNELLAAADAIKLETEAINACPYCGTSLGDPIQNSIKRIRNTEINFKSLPDCILSQLDTLVKIVNRLLYSSSRINEEEFVQENERVIKRSLFARMSRVEFYTSGYYGVRGKAIIVNVLQRELLHKSRITRSDTYPLDELTFIQTILVPECSILLIQEDLSVPSSHKDAFNILMSSHEYGLHVYPNPVEEDYDD